MQSNPPKQFKATRAELDRIAQLSAEKAEAEKDLWYEEKAFSVRESLLFVPEAPTEEDRFSYEELAFDDCWLAGWYQVENALLFFQAFMEEWWIVLILSGVFSTVIIALL